LLSCRRLRTRAVKQAIKNAPAQARGVDAETAAASAATKRTYAGRPYGLFGLLAINLLAINRRSLAIKSICDRPAGCQIEAINPRAGPGTQPCGCCIPGILSVTSESLGLLISTDSPHLE